MLRAHITSDETELMAWAREHGKHVDMALMAAHRSIQHSKRQIYPWQAACLYALACHKDGPGHMALEIGTARGYSATFIARAMPHSQVTTLNPNVPELLLASRVLTPLGVQMVAERSWDYLEKTTLDYDLIFVDGDHAQILRDLSWFNRLVVGGLMVFHDYSPAGKRACPPVYAGVNRLAASLGRAPDVLLMDDGQAGLAGLYRQEGETWPHIVP